MRACVLAHACRYKIWAWCCPWLNHRHGGTVTPLHSSEHRKGLIGEYQARLQVFEYRKGGTAGWKESECVVQFPVSLPLLKPDNKKHLDGEQRVENTPIPSLDETNNAWLRLWTWSLDTLLLPRWTLPLADFKFFSLPNFSFQRNVWVRCVAQSRCSKACNFLSSSSEKLFSPSVCVSDKLDVFFFSLFKFFPPKNNYFCFLWLARILSHWFSHLFQLYTTCLLYTACWRWQIIDRSGLNF